MKHVNSFERMIMDSDTYLIKFYFSITKVDQALRFKEIKSNPLKKWKMTVVAYSWEYLVFDFGVDFFEVIPWYCCG